MGSTYETDSIENRDEIGLALQAAMLVKSATNLVGCRSWLVARLTLKELRQRVDELVKVIESGSL
jgi:nitroreductase